MRSSLLVGSCLVLAASATAHADGGSTVQVGASTMSCSAFASLGCDGHSTTWTGINIGSLSYRLSDRYELAGMLQADSEVHAYNGTTNSMVMLAAGVRKNRGLGYMQVGVGLGAAGVSQRSIGAHEFFADQPEPVILSGVAHGWRVSDTQVARVILDAGTSLDSSGLGREWTIAGSVQLTEM